MSVTQQEGSFYGAEVDRIVQAHTAEIRREVELLRRSPASATLSAHDHVRELIVERDDARARAVEHHRRGDEARHEAAVLRARVAELEAALRELALVHRTRSLAPAWCTHCGASWHAAEHVATCPVGCAVRALGGVP